MTTKSLRIIVLFAVLLGSAISFSSSLSSSRTIECLGEVCYPEVSLSVDIDKIVGTNDFSLGFMLDWEWKDWVDSSVPRQLAKDANFKLIRFFDYRPTDSGLMPCTYWNETAMTGTFKWTHVDSLVQRFLEIGAEPLICFGGIGSGIENYIPTGMMVDPKTGLPFPESYAAYATSWVRHFKDAGLPAKYYEIINEPWQYFGWDPVDFMKLANYMQLFNVVAENMREEDHGLVISFDFIIRKPVLDYWLANGGADVDSLNFHKYGYWIAGQKTDMEMLAIAESEYFGKWPMGYSIEEARQVWFNARGRLLPVVNSESNFNSAWENGTDPRIQQMVGAVWTGLVLRMCVLEDVNYNIYYSLSSSASYGESTQTGGGGFGMVDSDNNHPWYPYYVHCMIGNSLGIGDRVLNTTSSSEDIRALAWIHDEKLNALLICKVNQPLILRLKGFQGQLTFFKIDNTISWETPEMQTGSINSIEPLAVNGYTVALLQAPIPS